jgi:glycosyltransferase involved in cell wall biosynthesis
MLIDEFRTPAERIAALPNGVDIDFFHPLPRAEAIARAGLDPDCRYAVFCGNFQPWVDFDTLLEGFSIVASTLTDARLLLVGDGPEGEHVDGEIRRLGIGDSVLKTGFVRDRSALRDLIAVATVTLSANRSRYRARIGVSPVKVAEYLACGRAVVATDLPGLRESIEETGVGAVTEADPRAFSAAMIALLDPKRAAELGANARRLAEERYAWRSVVHRTVPLFDL